MKNYKNEIQHRKILTVDSIQCDCCKESITDNTKDYYFEVLEEREGALFEINRDYCGEKCLLNGLQSFLNEAETEDEYSITKVFKHKGKGNTTENMNF